MCLVAVVLIARIIILRVAGALVSPHHHKKLLANGT
jgi:hypothetical protein